MTYLALDKLKSDIGQYVGEEYVKETLKIIKREYGVWLESSLGEKIMNATITLKVNKKQNLAFEFYHLGEKVEVQTERKVTKKITFPIGDCVILTEEKKEIFKEHPGHPISVVFNEPRKIQEKILLKTLNGSTLFEPLEDEGYVFGALTTQSIGNLVRPATEADFLELKLKKLFHKK